MGASVKDIIRRRKSVRAFSGEALRSSDRQKLDEFLRALDNPFCVPVEFRFLSEKKAKAFSDNPLGDIQKAEVGIALAHFDLRLKERGSNGRFAAGDPGFGTDDSREYIVIYEVEH